MWYLHTSRISICLVLVVVHHCYAQNLKFSCPDKNPNDPLLPHLPPSFSTNLRLNYVTERRTVEVRQFVKGSNEAIELTSAGRQVKYIHRPDKKLLLTIEYDSDEQPSCKVEPSPGEGRYFLKSIDSGPSNILKVFKEKAAVGWDDFVYTKPKYEDGTFLHKWEGCFENPTVKISIGFTMPTWIPFQNSSLSNVDRFIQKADVQMQGDIFMSAVFSRFNPRTPADSEFQPPEGVFCEGWGPDVPIPTITDYFTYNSEILVYESAAGIRPFISQRKVFYDVFGGISRTDFYDALADTPDIFTPITARAKTVIHDFKAGVQYVLDPVTGKCSYDEFETTFSVLSVKFTTTEDMPTSKKYFYMDAAKIYYSGQYYTRGLIADVFSAETTIEGMNYKGPSIVSWYFTTNKTQVVEGLQAEENVLLRMVVRPKAGFGRQNMAVVNFYNFVKAKPEEYNYDLTGCYNESYSKHLTLTFPAHESLKGYEKLIRQFVTRAVANATDIDRHRVAVKEVIPSQIDQCSRTSILNLDNFYTVSRVDKIKFD
ncbi:uncharacterized protein LOC129231172 [Uloborus diversus]|uniref:uncharacterized protein LOC129231172 n=1 Tax=Uloborus diversus TaxID=327109 RepID=UPI0024091158|nr:uncharacterized protein LOC129231172 [Uloborus diversus]